MDYYYVVSLHDAVNLSGSIEITSSTTNRLTSTTTPIPIPSALTTAHFANYAEKPVDVAIENTLVLLDHIVSDAEKQFGIP
jgi:hypothetical protein